MHQHTLSRPVSVSGHGLHTGQAVTLTLRPLPAALHTAPGYWVHRTDVAASQPFHLTPTCVQATQLRTEVQSPRDGAQTLKTIEHLLAALAASGVWQCLIECDSPEVPLLGGGSTEWLQALAGNLSQMDTPVPFYAVSAQTIVGEGDQRAVITPNNAGEAAGFSVTAHIAFDHPLIGAQSYTYTYGATDFAHEIAPCRTFALEREVKAAQAAGLIQGGTLEAVAEGRIHSAVVYAENGTVLNPNGLHFADEAVRHKVLDVLGDMAIAGGLPNARLEIWLPGHGFNNRVLRQIAVQA